MTGGTVIGRAGRTVFAAAAAAVLALAGALIAGGQADARGTEFQLVDVGDFNSPVHVAEAAGAAGLLFVVQQGGVIKVLDGGDESTFLNLRDIVGSAGNEEGLLSVAFHPDYANNRRLYVYYTNHGGDIRIDQFRRRKSDELRASANSRTRIIRIQHDQGDNHNGGQLQFGPDGLLYAGIGDGGPQMDPQDDAQTPGNLLGKLIRIEPLAAGGYDVPGDNPYADVGDPGRDEIYAIGLRNPWRFSFDSDTGALTIGDVGGGAREEIDYVAGPDAGLGSNFGWNDYEGFEETPFGTGTNASPHAAPIADFTHGAPDDFTAITGGYVVRDPDLPALTGQYLFADYALGELMTVNVPAGTSGTPIGLDAGVVSSFGEGESGQIYVVSRAGDVYRLEPA